MKTEGVKRLGYTEIYSVFEPGVDFDPSDDLYLVKCLTRYSLHDGFFVYQVGASYARSIKPSFYYVISATKSGAQQKFRKAFSWLDVILCVEPLLPDAAEEILSAPARHIVI